MVYVTLDDPLPCRVCSTPTKYTRSCPLSDAGVSSQLKSELCASELCCAAHTPLMHNYKAQAFLHRFHEHPKERRRCLPSQAAGQTPELIAPHHGLLAALGDCIGAGESVQPRHTRRVY